MERLEELLKDATEKAASGDPFIASAARDRAYELGLLKDALTKPAGEGATIDPAFAARLDALEAAIKSLSDAIDANTARINANAEAGIGYAARLSLIEARLASLTTPDEPA